MRAPYIREFAASLDSVVQNDLGAEKLSLVKTANGGLDLFSGGRSVLLVAENDDNRRFVVKCYRASDARRGEVYRALQKRDLSPYGCVGEYRERALTVVGEEPVEVDVLVSPLLQGVSLDQRACELCREGDCEGLRHLADDFDRLAEWLLRQDWAHGDLSPDNIVVSSEGVRLIDFDAAYLPELTEPRVEIGRAEYNHPNRDAKMDNGHIDDWALALLSINLHALAVAPSLMTSEELPLLSKLFVKSNPRLRELQNLLAERGAARAYTLCEMLCGSFPEVADLHSVFALRGERGPAVESFNVGSRWGLRCGERVVEPTIWDDVVCRKGEWFGRLNNTFYHI